MAVRCISLYLILLAAPWAGFSAWNGMIDATGWRFFALGAAAILCLGVFAIFVFTCFINLITRASRLPHERLSRTRNQSTVRREPARKKAFDAKPKSFLPEMEKTAIFSFSFHLRRV